ncbi:DUF5641 domain-containing protein [Trichonephila clavipes]|nr:DUF5641 domain-containing protein [Trichonephila clavipes]
MFLISNKNSNIEDIEELNSNSLNKRIKYRSKLLKDLRQRFRNEYLSQLIQKRNEKESRDPQIGEVVLVGDDNKKRLFWALAKIIELIPGRDGKIRTVRLKTQHGKFLRPIQRIYPLEIRSNENLQRGLEESIPTVSETLSPDETLDRGCGGSASQGPRDSNGLNELNLDHTSERGSGDSRTQVPILSRSFNLTLDKYFSSAKVYGEPNVTELNALSNIGNKLPFDKKRCDPSCYQEASGNHLRETRANRRRKNKTHDKTFQPLVWQNEVPGLCESSEGYPFPFLPKSLPSHFPKDHSGMVTIERRSFLLSFPGVLYSSTHVNNYSHYSWTKPEGQK